MQIIQRSQRASRWRPLCAPFPLRAFLGYLHRVVGAPLEDLSFGGALPAADRAGVRLLFDYIIWLQQERGIGAQTELLVIRSAMQAAKFVFHSDSKASARGRGGGGAGQRLCAGERSRPEPAGQWL